MVTMKWDVCPTLIVMVFLSAPQMAYVSTGSVWDETSCTDLPQCKIIL